MVLATFKKQVDTINLVELAKKFCIENEHFFYIFGKFKIRNFPRKFKLWGHKHHTQGVDQRELRRADISAYIYIYMYIYTHIYVYIYTYTHIYICT